MMDHLLVRQVDEREARQDYERRTSVLVAQRLRGVTYWDLRNFGTEPRTWDYGDWHHAVMGVELITESGPSSVLWTDTFYPYGVEVFQEPISQYLGQGPEGPEGWPVESHAQWRSRVGSPVLAVVTYWEHIDVGPARRLSDAAIVGQSQRYIVPIALRLDFEAGPVWMVAAMPGWPDVEKVFVPADEIMVVWSTERMRKIGFPEGDFLHSDRPS